MATAMRVRSVRVRWWVLAVAAAVAPHTQALRLAAAPCPRPAALRRSPAVLALQQAEGSGSDTDVTAGSKRAAEAAPQPSESADAAAEESSAVGPSPEEPSTTLLTEEDLINTRWQILVQPREEGWLAGGPRMHEFTLLQDGSVVWGEKAAGLGVSGRWLLRDEVMEVVRSTALGVLTGRDYYVCSARAEVTNQLLFAVRGVIRSYNAFYPVSVVADFVAVRQPGRFVLDSGDSTEQPAEADSE